MPSLIDLPAILEQIEGHVRMALPELVKVYFGRPRVENLTRPYACVVLPSVEQSPRTVQSFEQAYEFQIFLVYDLPSDKDKPTLIAQQEIQAALVPVLESGAFYAGCAEAPTVRSVRFEEGDEEGKDVMVVSLTLAMTTEQVHGV